MDKTSTFAKRVAEIISIRNITQAELSRRTGISKSSITHYLKGDWEGKQDAVYAIALAMNVDEAWLMGYDVPMERENAPVIQDDDERINEFVPLFQQLTDDQQRMIISQIKWFLANQ